VKPPREKLPVLAAIAKRLAEDDDVGASGYLQARADARLLLLFVDMLLEQLATEEKRRRTAIVHAIDGEGTWTCHACGAERLNQFVSVAHRKVEMPRPRGSVVQLNARYCNDRAECLRRVPDVLDEWAGPLLREKEEGAAGP